MNEPTTQELEAWIRAASMAGFRDDAGLLLRALSDPTMQIEAPEPLVRAEHLHRIYSVRTLVANPGDARMPGLVRFFDGARTHRFRTIVIKSTGTLGFLFVSEDGSAAACLADPLE